MKKLLQILTVLTTSPILPFFVHAQISDNPINQNYTVEALALLGNNVIQVLPDEIEYHAGDYRAIKNGQWNKPSNWEAYDAQTKMWRSALSAPTDTTKGIIYIPDDVTIIVTTDVVCHRIRLLGNQTGKIDIRNGMSVTPKVSETGDWLYDF